MGLDAGAVAARRLESGRGRAQEDGELFARCPGSRIELERRGEGAYGGRGWCCEQRAVGGAGSNIKEGGWREVKGDFVAGGLYVYV